MSTTLRDVAAAAGVSVMSACSVLTGGGRNVRVSAEKARRIREIAAELRYEPNLSARGLRTRRTDTIGVVFQSLHRFGEEPYYYQQLLDGVMTALFPRGYTLSLCPKLVSGNGPVQISNGRFDGLLWCCPDLVEISTDAVAKLRLPIVMVHAPQEAALGMPTFAADNEQAMGRVVDHLVDLGHRRLGFVVAAHTARTVEGKARAEAFHKAAKNRGATADLLLWDYEAKELEKYVSDDPPHTALAAYNDVHAGQLIARAKELGIRVPEDLSIVGFDSSGFCERTSPRLTSVFQPIERIAHEATQYLLNLIDAEMEGIPMSRPDPSLYDCRLDVRDSTAVPNPHRRGLNHDTKSIHIN